LTKHLPVICENGAKNTTTHRQLLLIFIRINETVENDLHSLCYTEAVCN